MEWQYDNIIGIIKKTIAIDIDTGETLLLKLLPLAILVTYVAVMHRKSNWESLFLRLVIGFVILGGYEFWMDSIRDISVSIINRVSPDDFITQYTQMVDAFQQKFAENQTGNFFERLGQGLQYLSTNIIINLSFLFYSIATYVMNTVRFLLASFLYKIGPLLVPFILFPSTIKIIGGWITSYISVLFWPLLWRIMLSIAVEQGGGIPLTNEGLMTFVAFNMAVAAMIIFSPMIITSLAAGIGTGVAASFAGAFATKGAFDVLKRTGKIGFKGTAGAVSGVGKSGLNLTQGAVGFTAATTIGGSIKNVMNSGKSLLGNLTAGTIQGMARGAGMSIRPTANEKKVLNMVREFMGKREV